MGMSMVVVIHVPALTSLSVEEYTYMIRHSEAKLIFVSDRKLFELVHPAVAASGLPVEVYSFDQREGVKNWKEMIETGAANAAKHGPMVEAIKKTILPNDFASLI